MSRRIIVFEFTVALAVLLANTPFPQFSIVPAGAGVHFRNGASRTAEKYLPESMTGGVAVLDFNGDGRLDLFFVNGARLQDPMPAGASPDKSDPAFWNRLYRNNGDGTFTDVTEVAGLQGQGYGMGVATGDYDNDGHPDLYVTALGGNCLYRNRGDGTFEDVTKASGTRASGWSAGAAFVDYDRDGLLDLFVARYLAWNFAHNPWCGQKEKQFRAYCHPDQFDPVTHILYRNRGNGRFEDVSAAAGLGRSPGKGLGVAIDDTNGDGWPDILVANDSWPQQLFRNRANGTFEEVALEAGLAYDQDGATFAGMGIDTADYNGDGKPDVFINALANQRYAIFRNTGEGFEYASGPSGVAAISKLHSGWGSKFVDYDNDGWKDLFVAQGHVMDNIELTRPDVRYLEPLLLMRNLGGTFTDVSGQSGEAFRKPLASRGAAFGDLDNDGWIDAVVNVNNGAALVLRNTGGARGHWLLISIEGTRSNRSGIGAEVRIRGASGRSQRAFASTAGSYLSSSDHRLHFGLGQDRTVSLIEVRWPSGTFQRLTGIEADRILTIREPAK